MGKTNQITNAGALKLQHASAQLQPKAVTGTGANTGTKVQFADILQKEADKAQSVQFSKHAVQRVRERGIEMTDGLLKDLNQAVSKAREKGARDVVIIGESGAFIVNVPHNVVVTTMSNRDEGKYIYKH